SMLSRLLDALKPHRAEALQRVRTNAFCLLVLVVLSYLLPIPSVFTAFNHAATRLMPQMWSTEWVFGWLCTLAAAVTIFLLNLLQGVYALKYPRAAPPPTPSKSPHKSLTSTPSTPNTRHPLKGIKSSPGGGAANQFQKPFTFSPTQSNPASSLSFSGVGRGYPSTPADTPSRGSVKYTFPSALDSSVKSSSTSSGLGTSFPASPSPVLAWRGKHLAFDVGKPLDGSFIGQILGTGGDRED
ncbi:hypothetical protein M378DRAFT_29634, partial [Amanita muscaria Koide BX008]